MDLRVKCRGNLCRGSIESNPRPASSSPAHGQTPRLQPRNHFCVIALTPPELVSEFFRSQPLVIFRRSRILLFGDELVEGAVLFRTSLERKQQVLHGECRRKAPLVERRPRPRVNVTLQQSHFRIADGTRDAIMDSWCSEQITGKQQEGEQRCVSLVSHIPFRARSLAKLKA